MTSAIAHAAALSALAPASHRSQLAKIRSLGKQPACTPGILATLCSTDPCLAFALISRANLFVPADDPPLTSLPAAVEHLGLPAALGVLFELPVLPPATTDTCARCFRFSFACAVMGVCLSRSLRRPPPVLEDPTTVFACGLLHDMGTIAGLLLDPDAYMRTVARQRRGEEDFSRILGEELGADTCELGEAFARRWHLPGLICDSIGHHRLPQEAPARPEFCAVINTARTLVQGCGFGPPLSPWVEPFDEALLGLLGLGLGDLKPALGAFLEEMHRLEMFEGFWA